MVALFKGTCFRTNKALVCPIIFMTTTNGFIPVIHESAFIHPQAVVTGDDHRQKCICWAGGGHPGWLGQIIIEDGCTCRKTAPFTCSGHYCIIERSCTYWPWCHYSWSHDRKNCLVGMNAVIMDNVQFGWWIGCGASHSSKPIPSYRHEVLLLAILLKL